MMGRHSDIARQREAMRADVRRTWREQDEMWREIVREQRDGRLLGVNVPRGRVESDTLGKSGPRQGAGVGTAKALLRENRERQKAWPWAGPQMERSGGGQRTSVSRPSQARCAIGYRTTWPCFAVSFLAPPRPMAPPVTSISLLLGCSYPR